MFVLCVVVACLIFGTATVTEFFGSFIHGVREFGHEVSINAR
jgi:hypothetical protein